MLPMISSRLRPWLGSHGAFRRLGAEQKQEVEQAVLRVVLVGLVYVYVIWSILRDGQFAGNDGEFAIAGAGFVLLAIAILAHSVFAHAISIPRRFLGMLADNAATTYCLIQMDEGGAFVLGVYLFVTFGNGFRFGRRYLHVCQVMAIVGFGMVLLLSPFWSKHLMVGMGFMTAILVLPFYVGVLTERITEAKRRADEANQAKGRFLANMSHEMRTPLNGVIAMADVLRETPLDEGQREIVETMTTSANLLLAQIEDVLDVSKIEAGRVTVHKRPFNLEALVSSTIKVIRPQARFKGLSLDWAVDPAISRWYSGDGPHVRQVLLNLLANAVKFTETGEVKLSVRSLEELSAPGTAQVIRFEVRDTGIGIPPEKQAKIFEPFTQADDSITRVYGGSGLGTTIARNLVLLMGGRIGLESAVGQGTLFWFEIPLDPAEAQTAGNDDDAYPPRLSAAVQGPFDPTSTHASAARRGRILVAEDNSTNQRVAQLILESRGHRVSIVNNGEAALDALEAGGFDIALFDLSMPGLSGLEALKVYRFTASKPIPVLILSANVTKDAINDCQQAGAAEFIAKPLRASILLNAIDRHLVENPATGTVAVDESAFVQQASGNDSADVDQSVLQDLSQLSKDPTFVDRLIDGYRTDLERLLAEISDGISRQDFDAVRDAAHALKGGSASVGALRLAAIATKLNDADNRTMNEYAYDWGSELRLAAQVTLAKLQEHSASRQSKRSLLG
jgi:two-component system, sensor histidine kinase RpfC